MDKDTIYISQEDIKIIDVEDYTDDLSGCFANVPEVSKTLLKNAKVCFNKIEQMLYSAPSFINMIKASVPKNVYQAILTKEQQTKIATGALKLMTKKDGTLMANLVNPKTNKIVSTISLENINLLPDLTEAMTNYATQMQLAQIAEQIKVVQLAIEDVRQGQEFDRLATAYSCQQKLLQAMEIKNPKIKSIALLKIASDAEDSRNLLMQSQKANLLFIKEQPESYLEKLLLGVKQEKINKIIGEIRESLSAVNMVSLVEAMAYQEMGESDAARKSLQYYASYIQKAYLETEGLVEKLDLIDQSPENYWSKILPEITQKIESLPCVREKVLSKGEDKNEKTM